LGIGSYIIATEPLDAGVAQRILPNRRVVSSSKNFLHYFRLSEDNRLLFGGRAQFVPSTPQSTRRSAEILQRDMVVLFPELRETQIEYVWSGNVCFSMDMMPHAGRTRDGVHFAMAYGGHGVAMATYLGAKLGAALLGKENEIPFCDLRFSAIPLYNGLPWFLPFAGVWFKFLDWIQ
jgi:glycine/D-amino acid oxidase-like deaminating enzyme